MSDSTVFVGFDGGGSTSRFLVSRGSGEKESYTYPLNLKYTDLGIEESVRGFVKCFAEILASGSEEINSMCISLSGASNDTQNMAFAKALRAGLANKDLKLHIESDSRFTLDTAYPDEKSGMLLIAGTGSVALAKKHDGDIVKVGGWGRLLGDEGSGYWIGLEALKYYCDSIDFQEEDGSLFHSIRNRISSQIGSELSILREKLYDGSVKPQEFAPIVFENHERDPEADEILVSASELLYLTVAGLYDLVSDDCDPTLILHGSIARNPVIFTAIADQCQEFEIECGVLDDDAVLNRALAVAEGLV